jgi:hypothetical protein
MYNNECPICDTDLLKNNLYLKFDCGHSICLDCNELLKNRLCPLCRQEIPIRINKRTYLIVITLTIPFFPIIILYDIIKKYI